MSDAPALHVWDRAVPELRTDPPDAYSLRLVVARTLYDNGRATVLEPRRSPASLGDVALLVHPSDRDAHRRRRRGRRRAGHRARAATVTLPVRADTAVAPGTAFIAFARRATAGASDLVDVDAPVTDLRVETTR